MFINNSHIHAYSPKAGANNPLESIFFKNINFLLICCKVFLFNYFVIVFFFHSNAQVTKIDLATK